MRCLTLAEGLVAGGHTVELMGSFESVLWLRNILDSASITLHNCEADSLDISRILALEPDWVVVDSYRIDADAISELNRGVSCLAIVDGDSRSIRADLYLDQNLGSEDGWWPSQVRERLLAGSKYCLVREDVVRQRKQFGWKISNSPPKVAVFLGGTDPGGAIVKVAESLIASRLDLEMILICPPLFIQRLEAITSSRPNVQIVEPTSDLPQILGSADLIVSAAGTSAWDICTIATPAVLIATVANQQESLRQVESSGLALGIDAYSQGTTSMAAVGTLVGRLVSDTDLRRDISERCLNLFDGHGKFRVVSALESRGRDNLT